MKATPEGVKVVEVRDPLLVVHYVTLDEDSPIVFHVHTGDERCNDEAAFGILIADVVRHVAKALKVDEDEIWRWVEAERENPTDIPARLSS